MPCLRNRDFRSMKKASPGGNVTSGLGDRAHDAGRFRRCRTLIVGPLPASIEPFPRFRSAM